MAANGVLWEILLTESAAVVTGSGSGIGFGGAHGLATVTTERSITDVSADATVAEAVVTTRRVAVAAGLGGTIAQVAVGAARFTSAVGLGGVFGRKQLPVADVITPTFRTVTPPIRRGIVVPQRTRTERVEAP